MINGLRQRQPEEYKRFHMCLLLKDWPEALRWIALVPERFPEACQLIGQENLHADALRLYKGTEHFEVSCK